MELIDMIQFADNNGFVRLKNVPNVLRYVKYLLAKDNFTPGDISKALYKAPGHTYDSDNTFNFVAIEPAAAFVNKTKRLLPKGWIMLSEEVGQYGKAIRSNKVMNIIDYEFVNTDIGYHSHGLRISYIDINGNLSDKVYKARDIEYIVLKPLSGSDINKVLVFQELLSGKAEPIHQLMMIHPEYKEDYNLYLQDCEKYGFEPIEKSLIKKMSLTTYDNNPMTFTKNGMFGWNEDDDSIIVNKQR